MKVRNCKACHSLVASWWNMQSIQTAAFSHNEHHFCLLMSSAAQGLFQHIYYDAITTLVVFISIIHADSPTELTERARLY